jgi:hypothetical protein
MSWVDLQPGTGVDQVQDLHALGLADESSGTALILDTIEHDAVLFQDFPAAWTSCTRGAPIGHIGIAAANDACAV